MFLNAYTLTCNLKDCSTNYTTASDIDRNTLASEANEHGWRQYRIGFQVGNKIHQTHEYIIDLCPEHAAQLISPYKTILV